MVDLSWFFNVDCSWFGYFWVSPLRTAKIIDLNCIKMRNYFDEKKTSQDLKRERQSRSTPLLFMIQEKISLISIFFQAYPWLLYVIGFIYWPFEKGKFGQSFFKERLVSWEKEISWTIWGKNSQGFLSKFRIFTRADLFEESRRGFREEQKIKELVRLEFFPLFFVTKKKPNKFFWILDDWGAFSFVSLFQKRFQKLILWFFFQTKFFNLSQKYFFKSAAHSNLIN